MTRSINRFIAQHNLVPKCSKVVVGLSGGPDSVFLLHFFAQELKAGNISGLIAAHLNHEWRRESHKDVEFCHEIAKKYDVQLASAKISELSTSLKFNGSKEELGRNARRYFFETVRKRYSADLIALAHHAQDQQETFFIRLIRGATLTGLTGIQPKNGFYIHPLLTTKKSDIITFLDSHKIPYLTDPSNESDEFLRNRIRNTVLPALRTCDNRFDKKFEQTLQQLQETEMFLQQITEQAFANLATEERGVFQVEISQLMELHSVMRQRILLYWLCKEKVRFSVSTNYFNEIIRFLGQPQGGSHKLGDNWGIVKKKGLAFVERH